MARYAVTVRGTREVTTEIIVEAKDQDAAEEAAANLVESDQFGSLDWELLDGEVKYDDVDFTDEVNDNEPLTVVRTRW